MTNQNNAAQAAENETAIGILERLLSLSKKEQTRGVKISREELRDLLSKLRAPVADQAIGSGRNMFYEGLFEGETDRQRDARLRWANDMRATFERHTGNGWFDKDWHRETGIWAAAWSAALASAAVAGEAQRRGNFLPEHVTQQMIWNVQAVIEAECGGLALDERQARNVMSFVMNEHGPDAAPQASEAVNSPTCDVGYARFSPFFLLSNLRRIAAPALKRRENWALAMELFAVGSGTARRICREAGIDPHGKTVARAALSAQPGAQLSGNSGELGEKGGSDAN